MSAPTMGRLWALKATGPCCHIRRAELLVWGRRENLQSLAPEASRCPHRRMVLVSEKNVTAMFSKRTRQLWSHRGPIPVRLCWKLGMVCPAVVGRLKRRMSQAAEEKWGAPLAVLTTTLSALGFTLAQGAFGVR